MNSRRAKKAKCPDCASALEKIDSEFGRVRLCFSCFGHLFTHANLRRALDESFKLPDRFSRESTQARECPACDGAMQPALIDGSSVSISQCEKCYDWWLSNEAVRSLPLRAPRKQADARENPKSKNVSKESAAAQDAKARGLLMSVNRREKIRREREENEKRRAAGRAFDRAMDGLFGSDYY